MTKQMFKGFKVPQPCLSFPKDPEKQSRPAEVRDPYLFGSWCPFLVRSVHWEPQKKPPISGEKQPRGMP